MQTSFIDQWCDWFAWHPITTTSGRFRLAQAIEDASVKMAEKYGSPKITTREMATMCPLPGAK